MKIMDNGIIRDMTAEEETMYLEAHQSQDDPTDEQEQAESLTRYANELTGADDQTLVEAGYLPVIETEPPEVDANHYAEPRYVERDGQIAQEWDVVELPPEPDEVSPEEIVDALMEVLT